MAAKKKAATAKKAAKGGSPLRVGESVVIRTVTYHYIGRVTSLDATEIVLEDASWLADSGRWGQALATGTVMEVEPYPRPVSIARAAVVDVTSWPHALPREAK